MKKITESKIVNKKLAAVLLTIAVSMPLTQLLPAAYAITCSPTPNSAHCYAVQFWPNDFTTQKGVKTNMVTRDPTVSTPSEDFVVNAVWVKLTTDGQNTLEIGWTEGTKADFSGYVTRPTYYYATKIGGSYSETFIDVAPVATWHWYEISDTNSDKIWILKIDSTTHKSIYTGFATGKLSAGGEVTDQNIVLDGEFQSLQGYTTSWSNWTTTGLSWVESNDANGGYFVHNCGNPWVAYWFKMVTGSSEGDPC